MLRPLHLYKYAQCEEMAAALSHDCVHLPDTVWETLLHVTALLLASWLLQKYKTEARKLHRGMILLCYKPGSVCLYRQTLWLFISGFVTFYIPESHVHRSQAGNNCSANRISFVHGHAYFRGEREKFCTQITRQDSVARSALHLLGDCLAASFLNSSPGRWR